MNRQRPAAPFLHCATLALLLMPSAMSAAGERIVDDERGFVLTLPDGFVPFPQALDAEKDIIHAFLLGNPEDDEPKLLLAIELFDGVLGRERTRREELPPEFQGDIFTLPWQGYEVNAVSVPEVADGVAVTTFNVQIPLRPRAIQLKLMGATDREEEMRELLDEIVSNLAGETNWSTTASTPKPGFKVVSLESATGASTLVLIGFSVAVFVLGLVGYWFVSSRGPKWAVLATAGGVWFVGATMKSSVREVVMLSGTLSFLGLAGVILGIIDLLRKPKKKRAGVRAAAPIIPLDAEVVEAVDAELVDAEVVDDDGKRE